jgi:hypothetical protein
VIDFRAAIVPAAIVLAFAAPHAASAEQGGASQLTLATSEIDSDRPAGATEGTLNNSISGDGTIVGYFRPVGGGKQLDVHGGVTGKSIYIDIDNEVPLVGTYANGIVSADRLIGRDQYHFTATPATNETT